MLYYFWVQTIYFTHRLPRNEASYSSRVGTGVTAPGRKINPAVLFPKIIVKFVRRETKELFYRSRKKLNGITTEDLTDLGRISKNNIYIAESLTAKNRVLFKDCLKFHHDYNFKYIWTNQGRIHLRKNESSPSRTITSQDDLDNLRC